LFALSMGFFAWVYGFPFLFFCVSFFFLSFQSLRRLGKTLVGFPPNCLLSALAFFPGKFVSLVPHCPSPRFNLSLFCAGPFPPSSLFQPPQPALRPLNNGPFFLSSPPQIQGSSLPPPCPPLRVFFVFFSLRIAPQIRLTI